MVNFQELSGLLKTEKHWESVLWHFMQQKNQYWQQRDCSSVILHCTREKSAP